MSTQIKNSLNLGSCQLGPKKLKTLKEQVGVSKQHGLKAQERLLIKLRESCHEGFTVQQAYKYIELVGFTSQSSVRSAISRWCKKNICINVAKGEYKFIEQEVVSKQNGLKAQVGVPNQNGLKAQLQSDNEFHNLVKYYETVCGGNKVKPMGYAGEDIVLNMNCKRCGQHSNRKMKENNKGFDIECTNCKQKTQVKTSKSISPKNGQLKNVTGGLYNAAIGTFNLNIDFVCLRYDLVNGIYMLKKGYYTKYENIKLENIKHAGKTKCCVDLVVDEYWTIK